MAQIVDEYFQKSVRDVFNIDKVTSQGIISFNDHFEEGEESKTNDLEKTGDGKIKYIRGLVELIERARAKAENDYVNQ